MNATPAHLLKRLREALNLSSSTVAQRGDVSAPVYHRFEGAENPTWSTLTKWADVMGATLTVTVTHPSLSSAWSLRHGATLRPLLEGSHEDDEKVGFAMTDALVAALPATDQRTCRLLALTILHEMSRLDREGVDLEEDEFGSMRAVPRTVQQRFEFYINAFQTSLDDMRRLVARAVADRNDSMILPGSYLDDLEGFMETPEGEHRAKYGVPPVSLSEFLRWARPLSTDAVKAGEFLESIGYGIIRVSEYDQTNGGR